MLKLPAKFQLESARCIYRQPTLDDIPHVFSASRFPGFTDGMLWEPPDQPEEFLPHFQAMLESWAEGSAYSFTIEDRQTAAFIGRISIRHQHNATWDFGFYTHPEMQNRGYMSEAVQRVMRFGFEKLGAEQIVAKHACWNKASERVMLKNGMCFIRHHPHGYQKRGEWVEENELGIKRESWLANQAK